MSLKTGPNLVENDDFYAALLAVHKGLDQGASAALNARLILILANHIGELDTLTEALNLAAET